jgi:EAL domain-containing protein (putative c-di-GMP-specific phosphodiesterase class I)
VLKEACLVASRIDVPWIAVNVSLIQIREEGYADKLKIDRSFVQQLGHSEDADTLVRAMVILARALRIQVTAEGVETQQQREILAEMGCNELQGFLMSRPVDASRFAKLLSESALVRSSA